jgi:hypothetical protein
MTTYTYREPSGYDEEFEAGDDAQATARARELLRDGDYGEITKTTRIEANIIPWDGDAADTDHSWRVTVDLEPDPPDCADGGGVHEWQDGTVYGSGGGVAWTDTCALCGLTRTTDTWDHDPQTGEVMETVRYERAAVPEDDYELND